MKFLFEVNLLNAIRQACKAALDPKMVIVPRKANNLLLNRIHSPVCRFDTFNFVLAKAGYGEIDTEEIKKALQEEFCRLEQIGKLDMLGTALLEIFPLACVRSAVDEGRQIRISLIITTQEMAISYLLNELLNGEEN